MWIPVVSDSTVTGVSPREESILEAIIEVIPDSALRNVGFVWVRDEPSDLEPQSLLTSFRGDARPTDRLAAAVHDRDGRLVLELYARNVTSSLSDPWLEENWGICPSSLPFTMVDKCEIAVFGLVLHLAVRDGLVDEAKVLVRLIGRVVFRAAVRHAVDKLLAGSAAHEKSGAPNAGKAFAGPSGPISHEEVARTDLDALLHRLLGLDVPRDQNGEPADNDPTEE